MDYMKKFQFWLDNDYFDEKTKEELLAIRNGLCLRTLRRRALHDRRKCPLLSCGR